MDLLQKRKNIRLKDFDYSQNGYFFLTICTHNRNCIFAQVGAIYESPDIPLVSLTDIGKIVKTAIENLPIRFSQIQIDKYVIMPNHIHLIIVLNKEKAIRESPLQKRSTLSQLVGYLKMNTAKQIHLSNQSLSVWQRGYYDHIIRNEQEYQKIWQYIDTNAIKWANDMYYINENEPKGMVINMKKDLLKMLDLSKADIIEILNLADQLKYEQERGIHHTRNLRGKTLGMIFQKASTRTRVSFEVGMFQLGGHALFLSPRDLQIGRGESIEDTARTLSRYLDGIMIRTYAQEEAETLAKYASIPIINGLTDFSHPCQVLADLMTIREHKSHLEGLKLCFIGDGNNMANSLIVGALKVGMSVAVACPKGYEPDEKVLAFAAEQSKKGASFLLTDNVELAAEKADVIITDVWASMGQEEEAEKRRAAFAGFQINHTLLAKAKKDCLVQHCLPAHKGEEITAEVFEEHQEEIFDEAENRLHAQKAVMVLLMEEKN